MPLTVLSDEHVKSVLGDLTNEELEEMQKALRQALHEYSTGTQEDNACASNQPMRSSMQSSNGLTTLFMPSTSAVGIGFKIVTLAAPGSASTQAQGDTTPRGSLQIMAPTGEPLGFMNAEELTAFRTALCSSLLLRRRAHVKTLTVFGAGKQAYWHIRLALVLRGATIKRVHIINRSFSDRARQLMHHFYTAPPSVKSCEGWTNTKFSMLTPGYGEYDRLLKEQVRSADVIYCTVPSTIPLFDHAILTSHEGRRKGRLIVGIGSYKPHMIEIPPELLQQATRVTHHHHHHHKHAAEGGAVIVDSLTACLKEAGEVIQAGLNPQQLVEIGELVMLEEAAALAQAQAEEREREGSTSSSASESLAELSINSDLATAGSQVPASPTLLTSPTSASPRSSKRISFDTSRPSMATVYGREDSTSSTSGDDQAQPQSGSLKLPSSPAGLGPNHHRRSSSQSRLRGSSPIARASAFLHRRSSSNIKTEDAAGIHDASKDKVNGNGDVTPTPQTPTSPTPSDSQTTLAHTISSSSNGTSNGATSKKEKEKEKKTKADAMSRWLCSGNVIYKSVGIGLMDLAVGSEVVRLAKLKGVGVEIPDF